jgi:hypothetical protein
MANDNTNTSPASNGAKAKVKQIEALVVKSVAKTFRRIGMAFTNEAIHLDPSLLTDEQVAALKSEPGLVVTQATVTVPVSKGAATTPVVTPIAAPADDKAAE